MENHLLPIYTEVSQFRPITLEEMSGVKLMNRTDTKYVISLSQLIQLLHFARNHYRIQETNSERLIEYHTTYFDTDDWQMLRAHTTGRTTRQKIRVRTYIGSNLTFIEIKKKNNKGRTKKQRIEVTPVCHVSLTSDAALYVSDHAKYNPATLKPAVTNSFKRITLVNNEQTERLTIDLDLMLTNCRSLTEQHLSQTVVVEVKRDGRQNSHIINWLNKERIRKHGFSKYCYGALLTDGTLPIGIMKRKMRQLLRKQLIPLPFVSTHHWAA